jgi:ankyrin repeat protein
MNHPRKDIEKLEKLRNTLFVELYKDKDKFPHTLKEFLDAGGDINTTDPDAGKRSLEIMRSSFEKGSTLLHEAVHICRKETICELLIKHGANVNAKTEKGHTPIFFNKNVEIAKVLIQAGADVNLENIDGDTPLHKASKNNSEIIVKLLLEAGANPNALGENKETPLHRSVKRFSHKTDDNIYRVLVEHGADIQALDINKWTPLHCAAFVGFTDACKFLVSKGANPLQKSWNGETPVELSVGDTKNFLQKHIIKKKMKEKIKSEIDI